MDEHSLGLEEAQGELLVAREAREAEDGAPAGLGPEDLAPTEDVLAEHGNMSSVTVLFVLDEMLRRGVGPGEKGVLGAFGPGFGAEFALLEFA